MRRSVALLLALVLALPISLSMAGTAVADGPVLAQDTGEESDTGDTESEESTGSGGESDEDPEGQDDPATETGVDEGQEGEAAVEEGPVWTYQMAWIAIGLLVLMGLAIARAYHHFVAQRRKSGI
ncbi:MAG: hypothetical protein ACR2KQ_06250 [Actinomycetota bacterium]